MKIDKKDIRYALEHITENGDTDIFPYPFELKFYQSDPDVVVDALASVDYNDFSPMTLIESLIPKSKFGFRVAHQPYPSDTVIYTALVCSIYDEVEEARSQSDKKRAFSYRKNRDRDEEFFLPDRNFRNWLNLFQAHGIFSDEYSHVIRTDISDFYMRIYRHRLENILQSMSGNIKVVKKIEKIIATWRGGQSFGLPVGCDASRLLAETALHDLDMALISEDYWHSRFVDDIVIFVKKGQNPYAALAFLARHLSENEGLSLNNQKTKIMEWSEFDESLPSPPAEDEATKEDWATERLFWAAYGQDELDQEAIQALMLKDLTKELEDLLAEPYWDMGAIRIILHAMRLVGSVEIGQYIQSNIETLIPFAKDVFLLIDHFIINDIYSFDGISEKLTDLVLSETMRPLDCARAWFLELGVRGRVKFTSAEIRRLDALGSILDIRQLHLIRWRQNDLNYFRSRKARINEIPPWAQPSFIFGASCLPKDEYEHWVRSVKSRLQFPLGKEFAEWCLRVRGEDPYTPKQQDSPV